MFLYHNDIDGAEHFHAITKITGFFSRSRFCTHCLKPYEKPYKHSCIKHCNICLSDKCAKRETRTCTDCHRTCRSDACYLRHKLPMEGGGIPCELMYKCTECLQTFHCSERKREDHQCGYYRCRSCHQYVEPEHLCYTRAHTPSSPVQRQYIILQILRHLKKTSACNVNLDTHLEQMSTVDDVVTKHVQTVDYVVTVKSRIVVKQDIRLC